MSSNINKVFDSIYLIPALLDHLEKPTVNTAAILEENGINAEDFRELKSMLVYHFQAVRNGYVADYELLRDGLAEYFAAHLSTIFQKLGTVNQKGFVLDYGCGSGQVSDQFKLDNPATEIYKVDKFDGPGITVVDFEEDPSWHRGFIEHFDTIILSEVLHCKPYLTQMYLVQSSYRMLVPDGQLIIIENMDYAMAYRISKIKGSNHEVVKPSDIYNLALPMFKVKNQIRINKHIAYDLRKV